MIMVRGKEIEGLSFVRKNVCQRFKDSITFVHTDAFRIPHVITMTTQYLHFYLVIDLYLWNLSIHGPKSEEGHPYVKA
jgi:hypothetical protein